MSDFTSGPWEAEYQTDDIGEWWIFDKDGYLAAETVLEANARLIAQSPALYEIATDLIDVSDMHGFDAAEILAGIEELAIKAEATLALVDKETT